MSTCDGSGTVSLTVHAGDVATEIAVIDSSFGIAARELSQLHSRLPPGLYKVQVRTAEQIGEVYLDLRPDAAALLGPGLMVSIEQGPDGAVLLRFPRLAFAAPAPLGTTAWAHPDHLAAAWDLSRSAPVLHGRGSGLFLFVRSLGPHSHPVMGLVLHDLAGRPLVRFERTARCGLGEGGPWAACNIELDPGTYRLRISLPTDRVLERTIVASEGWQTQLFILKRGAHPVDVIGSSLFMTRLGNGFTPTKEDHRLAELLRQGLESRRTVVSSDLLLSRLSKDLQDPMLGIYGAHLILMTPRPDHFALGRLARRLHDLVGPHPDVAALDLWLDRPTDRGLFRVPPMLASSWALIVQKSATDGSLIPDESLAALVADRICIEGPWLSWMTLAGESWGDILSVAMKPPDLALLMAELGDASASAGIFPAQWDPVEETLLSLVDPGTAQRRGDSDLTEGLVRALGMPPATVGMALVRLLAKLRAIEERIEDLPPLEVLEQAVGWTLRAAKVRIEDLPPLEVLEQAAS